MRLQPASNDHTREAGETLPRSGWSPIKWGKSFTPTYHRRLTSAFSRDTDLGDRDTAVRESASEITNGLDDGGMLEYEHVS